MSEENKVEISEEKGVENVESSTKKEVTLITDPQERLEALQEISVLSGLINTHYFMPKWDQGNRGTQEKKIVSAVQLNFFGANEMNTWGKRITDLTERLGM